MEPPTLPPPPETIPVSTDWIGRDGAVVDADIAATHAQVRDNWDWGQFRAAGKQTDRQHQLIMALAHSPEALSQREMFLAARPFGYPEMTNGSRISELLRDGAIRVSGRRACRVTGRSVLVYALTGNHPKRSKNIVRNGLMLYAILRDGIPVRIASGAMKAGPGETVAVFNADRRRSGKYSDGTSCLPEGFIPFEVAVPSLERRARRIRAKNPVAGNQPELPLG